MQTISQQELASSRKPPGDTTMNIVLSGKKHCGPLIYNKVGPLVSCKYLFTHNKSIDTLRISYALPCDIENAFTKKQQNISHRPTRKKVLTILAVAHQSEETTEIGSGITGIAASEFRVAKFAISQPTGRLRAEHGTTTAVTTSTAVFRTVIYSKNCHNAKIYDSFRQRSSRQTKDAVNAPAERRFSSQCSKT